MKKIKIMLSAIAVLAVVGGALAFKATKFSDVCVFKYDGNTCPKLTEKYNLAGIEDDKTTFISATYRSGSVNCNPGDIPTEQCTPQTIEVFAQ